MISLYYVLNLYSFTFLFQIEMFLIFSLMELSIIFTMIDLSQNKRPECVIGFDDNKIVYGTAGQKLTCQLEKMNADLFDTDFVCIK